jgi:hypothetical protein
MRLRPQQAPGPGHSASSSSSRGSSLNPPPPYSEFVPLTAVLDSRPGGARGEGDGLFASMDGASSSHRNSSQPIEVVTLPAVVASAAPTTVVQLAAAPLSRLAADLLR